MVRVTGIGRNEYIATMNRCKAKKLLWRVNKALAKEFLPTEPLLPAAMQPWWLVATVNLGMLLSVGGGTNKGIIMDQSGQQSVCCAWTWT